ncbi:MAG: hypothetical protein CMP12_19090 [Zunongwangia sp.]|uniref:Glycosyltransferase 2-like domain-containing protein n=1 Tax=Zunongwangia profunda TaxID=398743 RepID=A0A3D5IX69_9FLAO|nr:glycosyltransferase family 2 protein [Zunongwangia profunda]MAB91629.1 hypothetical protein [Planctomycetota bacterium]MAO37975.1 hypothetical protein [Zunongwangia sp.]MAS72476.1 hypothetical protein [Zunongwangia sp.]HCV80294.1 hypothetical protein [Zunongwangia profunda]|tara:strand:+ start:7745 stop:8635 length:891 start_codon:yes stop_codon:yes gene_type:complete
MLSIIIVNYKNEQQTIAYVKSELSKVTLEHIVVVVNNSATEISNEILAKELNAKIVCKNELKNTDEKIFIIPHLDNLGFAKGNNLGAEFSLRYFDVDFFIFSNNDIRFLDDNVVEKMIMKIKKLPHVGILGPKVVGLDGKKQSPEPYYSFVHRYFLRYWVYPFFPNKIKRKLLKIEYTQLAVEGEYYKVMGSFFLVRALDFVKVGMMDSNTFLYAEEAILTERMKAINKSVYYLPTVAVLHEHGATISKNASSKAMKKFQFESESYYYHKYRGVPKWLISVGEKSLSLYSYLKSKK